MKNTDWHEIDKIPLPDRLEERLSASIDKWETEERLTLSPRHGKKKWTGIAAGIAVAVGIGWYALPKPEKPDVRFSAYDTYTDPVKAKEEIERAVNLIAYNFERGIKQLDKMEAATQKAQKAINKYLN